MIKNEIKLGLNDSNVSLINIFLSRDYSLMSLELKNNTNKTIIGISVRVIQKDIDGKIIGVTDFDYNDFICKRNKSFLPKINIKCNKALALIDFEIINIIYKENEEISDNVVLIKQKRPITVRKNFIFLSILILSLIFAIVVFSFNYYYLKTTNFITDGTFKYELVSNQLEIVDYYKNDKEVTIPSSYDGYTVTSVDNDLFKGSAITKLTIESDVFYIGKEAFSNCKSLVTVKANDLTVDDSSFAGCSSLVTFDANILNEIQENCFAECENLTSISSDSTSYIDYYAFYGCTKLETIYFPNACLFDNAFIECPNIKNVTYDILVNQMLINVFPSVKSFDEVSNYESNISLEYFNDVIVSNLHLKNSKVVVKESLSKLNLSNYNEDSNFGYLDGYAILYYNDTNILNINSENIIQYSSLFSSNYITEININTSCNISSNFIEALSYLEIININTSNVKINSKLSSDITVNIYDTTTKLSNILPDNTLASINICSNVVGDFFAGTTQDTINISSDVSSISSNAFSSKTSIEKINVSFSSIFTGQILGVYELEIENLTSILPLNDIKKIVVSSNIDDSIAVLKNSSSLIILDIKPTLTNSYFATLFDTTNSNIPSTLKTIYINSSSVSESYFQNLTNIVNIAVNSSINVASASYFSGCSSLQNIYFKSWSGSYLKSLYTNLSTLASNNGHKINIISGSNISSKYSSNYLSYYTYVDISKTYSLKYNNYYYTYTGIFLTELEHYFGLSSDYVMRLYSSSTYSSSYLVNSFSDSSTLYCLAKEYQEFSISQNSITVSFYDGSTLLENKEFAENSTLPYYYPIEKTGYYFNGWYTDSGLTNLYDFESTVSKNLTLYAKYVSSTSYLSDNQEVFAVSSFSTGYTDSNKNYYSYYKKYVFYVPTSGTVNIMTIGNSDTFIEISNNNSKYSDDNSGIDSNANLSASVSRGTLTIYICSGTNESTTVVFTYQATSSLTIKLSNDDTVLYSFKCLPGESYTLDVSMIAKTGYTIDGIYTKSGYKVFDENGNSTDDWLVYSQSETEFVVIYK